MFGCLQLIRPHTLDIIKLGDPERAQLVCMGGVPQSSIVRFMNESFFWIFLVNHLNRYEWFILDLDFLIGPSCSRVNSLLTGHTDCRSVWGIWLLGKKKYIKNHTPA